MIVNQQSLKEFYVGLSTRYQAGYDSVVKGPNGEAWKDFTEIIPSNTSENLYGWLGSFPAMRKWIGERHIKKLRADSYRVANEPFESTVEVDRDALEDNQLGQYSALANMRGIMAAKHPSVLMFNALKNGASTNCYDGQFFFDTDHPKYNADGTVSTWSNFIAGAGQPWYLLSTNMGIKPLIMQPRRDYAFRALMNLEDPRVFLTNKYLFGVDARVGVGYGFPQMALASRAALTVDNLFTAIIQMASQTDENGDPLGIMPDTIVVGTSNFKEVKTVLSADFVPLAATVTTSGTNFTGGNTNIAKSLVRAIETPYLP